MWGCYLRLKSGTRLQHRLSRPRPKHHHIHKPQRACQIHQQTLHQNNPSYRVIITKNTIEYPALISLAHNSIFFSQKYKKKPNKAFHQIPCMSVKKSCQFKEKNQTMISSFTKISIKNKSHRLGFLNGTREQHKEICLCYKRSPSTLSCAVATRYHRGTGEITSKLVYKLKNL